MRVACLCLCLCGVCTEWAACLCSVCLRSVLKGWCVCVCNVCVFKETRVCLCNVCVLILKSQSEYRQTFHTTPMRKCLRDYHFSLATCQIFITSTRNAHCPQDVHQCCHDFHVFTKVSHSHHKKTKVPSHQTNALQTPTDKRDVGPFFRRCSHLFPTVFSTITSETLPEASAP